MLELDDLDYIEEQAYDDYTDDVLTRDFEDDYIEQEVDVQIDVDDFREELANCEIPGEVIRQWLADSLYDVIDRFLYKHHAKHLSDLAIDSDLENEDTYYAFLMRMYSEIEKLWFEIEYPQYAEKYFYDHLSFDD